MYSLELQNKILKGAAEHYAGDSWISWAEFGFESDGNLELWTNLKILENLGLIEVMHLGTNNHPTACNPIQLTTLGYDRINALKGSHLQKTSTFLRISIMIIMVAILGTIVVVVLL